MRTVPGAPMRSAGPATRVLCPTPDCGALLTDLPAGTRLLTRSRAAQATGSIEATCSGCGERHSLPTGDDHAGG